MTVVAGTTSTTAGVGFIRKAWEQYERLQQFLAENGDPRTRDRFSMERTDLVFGLTIAYLIMVYVGPKIMRNRQPFTLRNVMIVYNFAMTLMNLWMFLDLLINSRIAKYDYWCAPYYLSYKPEDLSIANAMYWYYMSKGIEYLDTLFMILKKKNNQISFLHVYHHIFMFPASYFAVALAPSGQGVSVAMINSLIHVIMYTYYGLAMFPSLHKFLWWKKYLTQLQLLQFVSLITVNFYGYWNSCEYPIGLYISYLLFATSLIFLFSNFYIQAYIKKGKSKITNDSNPRLSKKDD